MRIENEISLSWNFKTITEIRELRVGSFLSPSGGGETLMYDR